MLFTYSKKAMVLTAMMRGDCDSILLLLDAVPISIPSDLEALRYRSLYAKHKLTSVVHVAIFV